MSTWEITFTVECDDATHMNTLSGLTGQYLRAAMDHTRRNDARLIDVRLSLKEEPHAADDSAA